MAKPTLPQIDAKVRQQMKAEIATITRPTTSYAVEAGSPSHCDSTHKALSYLSDTGRNTNLKCSRPPVLSIHVSKEITRD